MTTPVGSTSQDVTLPEMAELYDSNFLDLLIPLRSTDNKPANVTSDVVTPSNPMIDALKTSSNQKFTANRAPALASTLSSTLDAFNTLDRGSSKPEVYEKLEKSWSDDPELTLRIIWNIRSIHDGKGEKELFYSAFGWLYNHHPRTAIVNLPHIVKPLCTTRKNPDKAMAHGYWKDLLNILVLATTDQLFIKTTSIPFHNKNKKRTRRPHKRQVGPGDQADRIEVGRQNTLTAQATARAQRIERNANLHKALVAKLSGDPVYRALYIAVARLFAEQLSKDIQVADAVDALPAGATELERMEAIKEVSLAGKWAPTPLASHDRHTNISTAIALLLRHRKTPSTWPETLADQSLDPQTSAQILRSYYQRWVLTRLRKIQSVPEPLMSANRWEEIKYTRVPSICMKKNTEHFFKHDPSGFQKFLVKVESGKKTISGATLFPHEVVAEVYALGGVQQVTKSKYPELQEFKKHLAETQLRVAEAQWKTIIERVKESGSLDNTLAICDVSGSMGHLGAKVGKGNNVEPIFPAVALSLILATVAKPPFNGGFITFSANPRYVQLDLKKTLYEQLSVMEKADWGMNTNFQAVFLDLLLPLAIKNNIKQEDMIKRLFVFSDMQFDSGLANARTANWETTYDVIEKKYKEAGYEVPQIVFWNLRDYGTVEVTAERKGVAMMNGFSVGMLKVFMGEVEDQEEKTKEAWEEVTEDGDTVMVVEEEEFNPVNVMKKALLAKSFDGLVVVD